MDRDNSFDFLRLVFAFFVIITHSYALAGVDECDWLCQLSEGQIAFSYLGVKGFFIISGYLIFQSLLRSQDLISYYWKRILRLYPGLIFVILVTIGLAPILYPGSLSEYVFEEDVRSYIRDNLLLFDPREEIAGIFENNPYKKTINGSLWTLSYEFTMYMILSTLFFVKSSKSFAQNLLGALFLVLLIGNLFFFEFLSQYRFLGIFNSQLLDLGFFFIAGALLASIDISKFKFVKELLLFSFIIILVSIVSGWFEYTKFILMPIFVITLGLQKKLGVNNIGEKIGDLSYGIYIFGFPVQQTLQHYFSLNYFNLMWSSMLVTTVFALVSWHVIESRALKYKSLPETLKLRLRRKKGLSKFHDFENISGV